ncbi:hypothetical protein NDU88_003789 [Pleurodeles waltl]|uniref:Uncharacterized protein n=1 Tax=Pleurodeles waltl TaxID=8319 RepID=A0AAV7MRQ5_PLEWA|nr:hypothetical protein NDU88_003789 [Pleurodeles waltl]
MSTSHSPKKTKRSYSLRSSRTQRPPALLDALAGYYDRLEEVDYPDAYPDGHPTGGKTGASFSRHQANTNGKSPLITEEPKEVRSKRKRRARSLRVTKTESRVFLAESSLYDDLDAEASSQEESPTAGGEPALGEAAPVTCYLGMDDGQQLIESSQEPKEEDSEREKQKSNKMKQYKKTIDRAFRRGWETFLANLYTVSLSRSAATPSEAPPPLVKAC